MSKDYEKGKHSVEAPQTPVFTSGPVGVDICTVPSSVTSTMKFCPTFENADRRVAKHTEICNKLHELYVTKNSDYGNSVSDTYKKFGMVSFLVRMQDKLNRVHSLTTKKQLVKDEQIEDTLLDLANYAILAAIELSEEKQN